MGGCREVMGGSGRVMGGYKEQWGYGGVMEGVTGGNREVRGGMGRNKWVVEG